MTKEDNANRQNLINTLQIYVDKIIRHCFYWNTLTSHVYICDISENEVRLSFCFTISKDKYLRSCRRMAIRELIEKLDKQLGIKKKYKTDIKYAEVKKTSKDAWNPAVEYGDVYVKYIIPMNLYEQLEILAKINKDYIISLNKSEYNCFI